MTDVGKRTGGRTDSGQRRHVSGAAGGRRGWTRASGRYCSPVARISTAAAVGDGEDESGRLFAELSTQQCMRYFCIDRCMTKYK